MIGTAPSSFSSTYTPLKKKQPQHYYGSTITSCDPVAASTTSSTNCQNDDDAVVPNLVKSKSILSQLTRSTSIMTWGTYDTLATSSYKQGGVTVTSTGPAPAVIPPRDTSSWPTMLQQQQQLGQQEGSCRHAAADQEEELDDLQIGLDCEALPPTTQQEEEAIIRLRKGQRQQDVNDDFLPMWISAGTTRLVKNFSFIGMPSSLGATNPTTTCNTTNTTSNIAAYFDVDRLKEEGGQQQQQQQQQQQLVSDEQGIRSNTAAATENASPPPTTRTLSEVTHQRATSYYRSTPRSSSSDLSNTSMETSSSSCVEAQEQTSLLLLDDDISESDSFFTSTTPTEEDDIEAPPPPCMLPPPSSFVVKDLKTLPMNYNEILKEKATALNRNNWDLYESTFVKEEDEKSKAFLNILETIISKGIQVKEKAKGVEDKTEAPYFPVSECMWTFVGSFSILSLVTLFSSSIALWYEEGNAFAFPLGPFGALTTLQCSLTDAAPAQPRNVLCGSTLCGCIALLSTFIPEEIVPLWLRISLATSISISAMARLGIMHPPGGAIALVFSMGGHSGIHLVLTLMSCCLAVFVATVINNLNDERQYPRYWNILAPLFQNRTC